MKLVRCSTAVVAAIAAGFLAAGCGSDSCAITPDLRANAAPATCPLQPNSDAIVYVPWCACGATTCDVTFDAGSGIFQLEPRVDSCDSSCTDNPASCSFDAVPCHLSVPSEGSGYLYVSSGLDAVSIPWSASGSLTTCGS